MTAASRGPAIKLLLTIVTVLAVACGGAVDEAAVGDGTAGTSETTSANDVLAVTAPTLDGGTLDFADLAGRDVALWMWAPW